MRLFIMFAALMVLAGCATGRDSQQQLGKSNPAAYHYQMGLSFLGERNYTSALIELTEAEKLDPDNPDLLYNLGLAYLGKRRPDLAEMRLQRAVALKPNNSTARNVLGVTYLELKRWDNAIQQFKIVKDAIFYENSENATINLGLAYLGNGEYAKAMEELRIVIAANPRNPVAYLSLGRVLFAMDKNDQAINTYKKALEVFPDYGDAHYYLGLAYLKAKRIDEARAEFKETVRLVPDFESGRSSQQYLDLLK